MFSSVTLVLLPCLRLSLRNTSSSDWQPYIESSTCGDSSASNFPLRIRPIWKKFILNCYTYSNFFFYNNIFKYKFYPLENYKHEESCLNYEVGVRYLNSFCLCHSYVRLLVWHFHHSCISNYTKLKDFYRDSIYRDYFCDNEKCT